MIRNIGLENTHALALGAGILGTGGGGNTYLGRLRLERQLRLSGVPCPIVHADELPDDALVVGVGGMGAPTVSIEKIEAGDEVARTVRALASHLGRDFDALVISEIGGSNALGPLICGLQLGLPVLDGDGMGARLSGAANGLFFHRRHPGQPDGARRLSWQHRHLRAPGQPRAGRRVGPAI